MTDSNHDAAPARRIAPGGAQADGAAFDLFVIGGGINGAGIARDAAGRGLAVALAERGDFAGATSSASSKLIHGGLRYLEHYEFRLVAEALAERERLLAIAPHLAWPLRFVLPHARALRPAWMLRAGLLLYDNLHRAYGVRRTLAGSKTLRLAQCLQGKALQEQYQLGFEYSDAWVDDARLVIANLIDARERGATILARCEFAAAEPAPQGGGWRVRLRDGDGAALELHARAVVNAAGPWVREAAGRRAAPRPGAVQLVKGSHIVVPRAYDGAQAYILQNDDGRIVFLIPYEQRFTLVGTTDLRIEPAQLAAPLAPSEDEIAYLLRAANRWLRRPLARQQVLHGYAGVRPLYDDGSGNPSETTRDYVLARADLGAAAWLDIYGGKITTYRRLAEEALDRLADLPGFGARRAWTGAAVLPGGDFGADGRDFAAFFAALRARHAGLPAGWLEAAAHRHGSRIERWLGGAQTLAELGRDLGGGMTEAEADYLRREEWARDADDLMWRRSKCGLQALLPQPPA
jgi:glycerol-3-phosphate dehydrogenase